MTHPPHRHFCLGDYRFFKNYFFHFGHNDVRIYEQYQYLFWPNFIVNLFYQISKKCVVLFLFLTHNLRTKDKSRTAALFEIFSAKDTLKSALKKTLSKKLCFMDIF